jgi:hypothetical protein
VLLFGSEVTAVAVCPGCGEALESRFDIDDVRVGVGPGGAEVLELEAEGLEVSFRLPASHDLVALATSSSTVATRGRRDLLARCVVSVQSAGSDTVAGGATGVDDLPESVVAAVTGAMAAADPQADVELALCCPSCATPWAAPFDIAGFLWAEVHACAVRLLRDVDHLARAYGWPERDVLSLSAVRRGVYLELSRR